MSFFRSWRRRRLRARPFPPDWDLFLSSSVPLYNLLPEPDRRELQSHILVFLDEKRFEGCDGLRITDEVRLVVAAQACVLLLHRPANYYPRFITILVYPDAYTVRSREVLDGHNVIEFDEDRAGEAWPYGTVVLSWKDVLASRDPANLGYNVVLHEFAHELDVEYSLTASLESTRPGESAPWARTLQKEYSRLCRDVDRDRPTVLRDYGASNLAEFFAVATEAFFELPLDLREYHPDLYAVLSNLYRIDPASWHPEPPREIP